MKNATVIPAAFLLAVLLLVLAWTAGSMIYAANRDSRQEAVEEFDRDVGVTTVPLDRELAGDLGLPADASGLVVTSTAARRAPEIHPGDVIEAVNGRPVANKMAANSALGQGTSDVDLLLNQRGSHRHLHFSVAPRPRSAKLRRRSGRR